MKKLITLILITALTACGWQLRGYEHGTSADTPLPTELNLKIEQRNSKMRKVLQQRLKQKNIAINSQAPITLVIEHEHTDKRPLSVTDTGITAQYQLTLTINYHYQTNSQNQQGEAVIPSKKATSWRNYDFDAKLIVSKNQEEIALLDEMREELALRILSNIPQ